MSCLYDTIIGLTRDECPCSLPIFENATDSDSGLFLDELVKSDLLEISECDDVWTQMNEAKENAILYYKTELNALLLKRYQINRPKYTGSIGRVTWTAVRSLTGWAGIRLYCANVVSGILRITNIVALFEKTGTKELFIYNNLNELVETITINTLARARQTNKLLIELPLSNRYVENLEYFIFYAVEDNRPLNNDIRCNCGGWKPVFNTMRPYYNSVTDRNFGWAKWMMAGSYHSQSLPTDFSDIGFSTDNYLNGLTLDVEMECNIDESICKDSLQFTSDPLAMSIAMAILYKAGYLLYVSLLNGVVNRENLFNPDQLRSRAEEFKGTYNEIITYISQNINLQQNDCWTCKDKYDMKIQRI